MIVELIVSSGDMLELRIAPSITIMKGQLDLALAFIEEVLRAAPSTASTYKYRDRSTPSITLVETKR